VIDLLGLSTRFMVHYHIYFTNRTWTIQTTWVI